MTEFHNKPVKSYFFIISLFLSGIIINGLGVLSPAYLSIIVIIFSLIIYSLNIKSRFLYSNVMFFLLASWFFLEFFINPTGDKKTGFFLIVSVLMYPVFDLLCKPLSKTNLIIYSKKYIKFVTYLHVFELLVRLKRVNFNLFMFLDPLFFIKKFYLLKEDIILGGADTNFIATHLLIVFFFALYLKKRYKVKLNFYLLLISILIFFTFSRASWIALIFGIFTFNFVFKKNKLSFLRLLLIFFIIIIFFVIFISILSSDGSFQTKIDILNITIDFIKNANLRDFLLGLGFLNSIEIVKSYVAHNLISTLLMDTGFVSVILYFLCWGIILKQSKGYALFILLPIFIFSLSFIQQMIPYLFCCLSIITNLEEKNDFNNYSSL